MLQHSKQVTDCEDISYYKPIKLLSFNWKAYVNKPMSWFKWKYAHTS